MNTSSLNPAAAVAYVIREALMAKRTVHLPGLGTLRVEHSPSSQVLDKDQHRVFAPPCDVVAFDPKSK